MGVEDVSSLTHFIVFLVGMIHVQENCQCVRLLLPICLFLFLVLSSIIRVYGSSEVYMDPKRLEMEGCEGSV